MKASELRAMLFYEPSTGTFTWAKAVNRRVVVGSVAGSLRSTGQITIRLNSKAYLAHRLAWLYVHGTWPTNQIDHINGDPSDNRIANLRDVPQNINCQNRRRAKRNNSTGLLGVSKRAASGLFTATIFVGGTTLFLGNFRTAEAAHAEYLSAKRQVHKGNTL